MPGRAIVSEFVERIEKGLEHPKNCPLHCIRTCDYTTSPYCIMKVLHNAAKGNMTKGYAFVGANAYLARKISSVKEIVNNLKKEFNETEIRLQLLNMTDGINELNVYVKGY